MKIKIQSWLAKYAFVLLCILPIRVFAVDYYVSESLGSDTNSGLSELAPFQSVSMLNQLSLQPGDRVLFKAGDRWQGMFWPKGSGTVSDPIVIGSYESGDRPVIDGNGYQSAILIFNDDNYRVENLELTNQESYLDGGGVAKTESGFAGIENDYGTGRNVRFGIKVVASTRSLSGFAFSNLYIHNIFPSPTNTNFTHQGYGIKFESQSDVGAGSIYTVSNVLMESLIVAMTGHYGIWIRPLGLDGIDDYKHDNFTLRNSTFLETGGSGFVAAKASNVLVEDNLFDGAGSSMDPRMWQRGSGLWPFDSRDVIIQRNMLMNSQGHLDSYGVHIDYNNVNVVVQYNYSYNNEGGFAQILGANDNCGYRYNISVADGYRLDGVDGGTQDGRIFNVSNFCNINAGCPSTGNFIYNNTIYVPSSISPELFIKAGSGETTIKNNLIYVEQGNAGIGASFASSGVSFDISHNLFYPQALFSLPTVLQNQAIYVDPLLREPGQNDPHMYKLRSFSPAKLSGVPISGSAIALDYLQNNGGFDYFGFFVADSAPPHVGAYNGDESFSGIAVPTIGWLASISVFLALVAIGARANKVALG